MTAYGAFVQRHADAIVVVVTLLSLFVVVGWVYVLRRIQRHVKGWFLSLPECPDCGGRGTFGTGREKRWSCERCGGFGRLKGEPLRETVK